MQTIQWYHYIAAFFAELILTNAIPHFFNGISGNRFPTPFANPPGKGLSSPLVNILWASLNLVIGYIILRTSKVSPDNTLLLLLFFIGMLVSSIFLSTRFAKKAKD